MTILAWLAKTFLAAFGEGVLEWLSQKRAERAREDLGAMRERAAQAQDAADSLKRQQQAAAHGARSEDDVLADLDQGKF